MTPGQETEQLSFEAALARLEGLGLVVSTTHERGKVKTYYVSDPPSRGLSA